MYMLGQMILCPLEINIAIFRQFTLKKHTDFGDAKKFDRP